MTHQPKESASGADPGWTITLSTTSFEKILGFESWGEFNIPAVICVGGDFSLTASHRRFREAGAGDRLIPGAYHPLKAGARDDKLFPSPHSAPSDPSIDENLGARANMYSLLCGVGELHTPKEVALAATIKANLLPLGSIDPSR